MVILDSDILVNASLLPILEKEFDIAAGCTTMRVSPLPAYVDLGLQDRSDASEYFSDMRHLSGAGARDYSRRLGQALARAQQAGATRAAAQSARHQESRLK